MFGIGAQELIVILVIVLILFGSKKLPEFSRGLGEAVRDIRKSFSDNEKQKKPTNSKKTSG